MPTPGSTPPADVSEERGWFDHLAEAVQNVVARPTFFLACAGLVVIWAAVGPFVSFTHRWLDVILIFSALVTFFLVLLLENNVWRTEKATQRKLNAIAGGLAVLMEAADLDPEYVRNLHAAVALEKRESTSH